MKRHVANCTSRDVKKPLAAGSRGCAVEDFVWRYARRNLAVLNIFIKVRIPSLGLCMRTQGW